MIHYRADSSACFPLEVQISLVAPSNAPSKSPVVLYYSVNTSINKNL